MALIALLASRCLAAPAEPGPLHEGCYVRTEPSPASSPALGTGAARSHLGIRPKTSRLFEVELSIVGPGSAVCSVSGVARLRDSADGELLTLPIRPESTTANVRGKSPCLMSIHAAATTLEITTSEAACQAQAVCGGQVKLQGQRFELAGRIAPGAASPCFARAVP